MANLMLHAGGQLVTLDEVRGAVTPEPVGAHYPVPHARVLDLAVEGLEAQGLRVIESQHALAHDGDRYFGIMTLANGTSHDDYQLIAAVRNTHDKSFAASMALGSRVFVCDNLAFSGEVTFARKHTRFAHQDLPRLVNDALGRLGDLQRSQELRIAGYQAAEMTDNEAYATIVRASLARVIPNAKIKDIVEQWHEPLHPEFEARTGWSLFNGFTEILKACRIEKIPARTQVLHGVMDSACGVSLNIPRHVVVEDDILLAQN